MLLRTFLILYLIITALTLGYGQRTIWVDPGQRYIRIPVWEDDFYRISRADINNFASSNGENVSGIALEKFALYFRGEEVPMIREGNDLLFYGRRNDGSLDSLMFLVKNQANPKINILSDTAYYFLTWFTDNRIGKREITAANLTPTINASYYLEERVEHFIARYFYGENYYKQGGGVTLRYASYQEGEGWVGHHYGGNRDYLITGIDQINSSSGVKPFLEIQFNGGGPENNSFSIELGKINPRTWISAVNRYGYGGGVVNGEIEFSDIEGDSLFISVIGLEGQKSINSARLVYPKNPDFGGMASKEVFLGPQGGGDMNFAPGGFPSGSDPSQVLGLEIKPNLDIVSYPKSWDGSNNRMVFRISGLNSDQHFWFLHKDSLSVVSDFEWYAPRNLQDIDPNYIILTHSSLAEACNKFASYRESEQGGGYNAEVIDFEEIRNFFSYGEFTPLAIREMVYQFYSDTTEPDLSLFIVGKGVLQNLRQGNRWVRFEPELSPAKNLVPTFGFPGSDLPLSTGFDPNYPTIPVIPVGRLSVSDSVEARHYFEKVYQLEEPSNKGLWNKRALHLSGGADEAEIGEFFSYVNQFKDVAESPYWGAEVKTFSKKSTGSTENIIIDSVVNEGLSLITMYGHSSVNFSDIQVGDIDDPNLNYNNRDGKFPLFVINGCYSGRIFEGFDTWAENWTLAEGKGSIGVISQTDQGFNPILKHYTLEFYKSLFESEEGFGSTIGEAQIRTIRVLTDRYGSGNRYIRAQNELMIIHGDPNIRLNYSGGKTDYAILDGIEAKAFNTTSISSEQDSFLLSIPVANLGITSDANFSLQVIRDQPFYTEFPIQTYQGVHFLDTIEFTIPKTESDLSIAGRNSFTIRIDPGNPKNELDTLNNLSNYEITIPWKGVDIVFPREFSITPVKEVVLQLSSFSQHDGQEYIVEIDTSYLFNSPGLISRSLVPSNGYALKEQNLSGLIRNNDSTVFYMRAKEQNDTIWDEVSFSYFEGSDAGWSQSRFGQLLKNTTTKGLFADSVSRKHVFKEFSSQIELVTPGGNIPDPIEKLTLRVAGNWLVIDGALQEKDCKDDRLNFVRLSSFTGLPTRNLTFWDPRSCGISPISVKSFRETDLSDSVFFNYIGEINEDEILLGFTMGDMNPASWPSRAYDSLAVFGLDSSFLKTIVQGQPLIFLGYREINPGDLILVTSDTTNGVAVDSQLVALDHSILLSNEEGGMISTLIGPSIQWKTLFSDYDKVGNGDRIETEVYGISQTGQTEFLLKPIPGLTQLSGLIDAEDHPYLFLQTSLKDSVDRSAPLLDHWGVSFDSPPDGYLRRSNLSNGQIQSVSEGEEIEEAFWFINHTPVDFPDSIRVRVSRNGTDQIQSFWIQGPEAGDSVGFDVGINTLGYQGLNEINVFVNPFETIEETFQNNFVDFTFESQADRFPPVLSVYFDGHEILDEDVVSNDPIIDLYLRDDNSFLEISDPDLIYFQLFKIEEFDEVEILPNPGEIQNVFDPVRNLLNVEFQPETLEPGNYRFIANGRDVRGNRAGFLYYSVDFKVQAYQGISQLEFFPNPFKTSLNLSFFLSGNDLPETLMLYFYNRHGKKVGEIDLRARVKLGSNRIYDIWEGRDETGLPLQGGLYFIKFVSEKNGNLLPVSAKWGNSNLLKFGYGKVIYLPAGG